MCGIWIQASIDGFYLLMQQCQLNSIANPSGAITAQNRADESQNTGFAFYKCNVTGSGSIYLGRAWGPASRVVYSFTYFDDIILPAGWFDWNDPSRQAYVILTIAH